MTRRRALAGAILAALLAAPGHAFWMPLPVHDPAASVHAGSLLANAQNMLEIAGSMQNTLENIEASIDAGLTGFLSKVPLPGGWLGEAGRQALLTGQVPYTTLASGVLDTFELSPDMQAMIGTGVSTLSQGGSPVDIAVTLGVEQLGDATGPEVEQWAQSAGEGGNPDQHLSAVIRLAQTRAAGAPAGGAGAPQWVNRAIDAGSGATEGWIARASGAPPWMVNLGLRHAGAPVRTALGTASHAVSPAVMQKIGEDHAVMAEMAGAAGTPPPGSEAMLASTRTAAAALAGHESVQAGTVALGDGARAYFAEAHPSAPMRARIAHTPHDVETVVWTSAEAGAFDGHIEMQTMGERNESAEEERARANLQNTMMAGSAEPAMIAGPERERAAENVRTLMAAVDEYRYDGEGASVAMLVDRHAQWALEAMGPTQTTPSEWRDIDHEGAKRTARHVAELGLGALNERGAQAAQEALPAGAAARARHVCKQLNTLGFGSDLCRWVKGASVPGRSAASGSEASARRWDRVNVALMQGEAQVAGVGEEGVSAALEAEIRASAENRRTRTSEEAGQAQTGCLALPRSTYAPRQGALAPRACPGNPDIAGDVACPIGTPEHGEDRWRVAPTDSLHVAGPTEGPGRTTHVDVLRVKNARAHYVLASAVEAMGAAASAQSESARNRRQAVEMLERLESCEDLLCELRVMGDAARLEAEGAALATHLELSQLDLRIAESIAESHLWRH